ncbi:S8 family serine peptidase [Patescibacteria group bacterium]|nr:S8 family serine peptidase [Patescibacteria group bacterium]
MKKYTILLASVVFILELAQPILAAPPAYVKGEVLVQFSPSPQASSTAITSRFNVSSAKQLTSSAQPFYKLSLAEHESVEQAISRFNQDSTVINVQPNYIYRTTAFSPNDALYSYQWNFEQINVASAWEYDTDEPLYGGDEDIMVAVLDTGVAYEDYGDYTQAPDMSETNFTAGYDYVNSDSHPNDDNGHGTHMAGTIAQTTNNALASAGIAFNTTIMPIKVLAGNGEGTSDVIIQGIQYAMDNGADVINMSFSSSENNDQAYSAIVAEASDQGIIMVAAAGNSGGSSLQYPASDDHVIGVGATRYDETRPDYSNYGAGISLVAPGGDIDVDQNNDGAPDGIPQQSFTGMASGPLDFGEFDNIWVEGTSSSAAHVSGAVALLLAHGVPAEGILEVLQSTAQDLGSTGYDNLTGYGLLDLEAAFNLVSDDSTAPITTLTTDRSADASNNYFLDEPLITLTSEDESSDIASINYRWGDDDYTQYADPFVPPEGTQTLSFYSVDVAGNSEAVQQVEYTLDTRRVVVGANTGGGPHVRVFSSAGINTANFFAYAETFRGGVNVAMGDVDGDGREEIVTAPGPGGGPHIRVFSLNGTYEKDFFAYSSNFHGGVNLAVGDLDGGKAEIVTVPMSSGGPNVRVFGYRSGEYEPTTENFMAYADSFRGGVSVTVADLEGDGIGEIVTAPLSNGGPQLRVFGYRSGVFRPVILGLMAYADSFRGGVTLASGDVDGDGKDEIITGIASAGGPHIRIFGRQPNQAIELEHPGFMAFAPGFRGGTSVATVDYQSDGIDEIVVAVRDDGNPLVRYFNRDGTQLFLEYLVYDTTFKNGLNLIAN